MLVSKLAKKKKKKKKKKKCCMPTLYLRSDRTSLQSDKVYVPFIPYIT